MLILLEIFAAFLLVGLVVCCLGMIVPLKFLGLSRPKAVLLTLSALATSFGLSMFGLQVASATYSDLPQKMTVQAEQAAQVVKPTVALASTSRVLNTLFDFEHSEFCQRYACREDSQSLVRNGGTNHSYRTNLEDVLIEVQDNSSRQPPLTGFGIMFFNRDRLSPQDYNVVNTLVRSAGQSTNHAKTMAYIAKNIETDIACQTCRMEDSKNFVVDGDFHVWAIKVFQQQVGWRRTVNSKLHP
jgi:hypothetical protein